MSLMEELLLFLQGLNYSIYIIEQSGSQETPFNRAKLFNVGVIEGIYNMEMRSNMHDAERKVCYCVILHDVDMVPVSNFYINITGTVL